MKAIKLYHFTAARFVHGVLEEGLTKGSIPVRLDPPKVRYGYQWLTRSEEFDQSWNTMTSLDYDRTAYRLTVEIPSLAQHKLIDWHRHCRRLVPSHVARMLNAKGNPKDWVLYNGVIQPQWIVGVDAKEGFAPVELDKA